MDVLNGDSGPYIIAVPSLSEIAFMIERNFPPDIEVAFLDDLRIGAYTVEWQRKDFDRIRDLLSRYAALPLGFTDAAIVACAERNGGRVLTLDRRHFNVVARGERTLTVLP